MRSVEGMLRIKKPTLWTSCVSWWALRHCQSSSWAQPAASCTPCCAPCPGFGQPVNNNLSINQLFNQSISSFLLLCSLSNLYTIIYQSINYQSVNQQLLVPCCAPCPGFGQPVNNHLSSINFSISQSAVSCCCAPCPTSTQSFTNQSTYQSVNQQLLVPCSAPCSTCTQSFINQSTYQSVNQQSLFLSKYH